MPLDWLINSEVKPLLSRPPVLELWGPEFDIHHDPQMVFPDGTRPYASDAQGDIIGAWRARRRAGPRYFLAFYRGQAVKAVHMQDCCDCVACHPEYHGVGRCMCHWPVPRKHGPGVCQCQWHREGGYPA